MSPTNPTLSMPPTEATQYSRPLNSFNTVADACGGATAVPEIALDYLKVLEGFMLLIVKVSVDEKQKKREDGRKQMSATKEKYVRVKDLCTDRVASFENLISIVPSKHGATFFHIDWMEPHRIRFIEDGTDFRAALIGQRNAAVGTDLNRIFVFVCPSTEVAAMLPKDFRYKYKDMKAEWEGLSPRPKRKNIPRRQPSVDSTTSSTAENINEVLKVLTREVI